MTFDEWFEKQFGLRPDKRPASDLWQAAKEAEREAQLMRYLCQNVCEWEAMRTAARYAWNLKDSDK